MKADWWGSLLAQRRWDARYDAEKGVFDPPHPGSDDPTDEYENFEYEKAWKKRRLELGDALRWKDD